MGLPTTPVQKHVSHSCKVMTNNRLNIVCDWPTKNKKLLVNDSEVILFFHKENFRKIAGKNATDMNSTVYCTHTSSFYILSHKVEMSHSNLFSNSTKHLFIKKYTDMHLTFFSLLIQPITCKAFGNQKMKECTNNCNTIFM